MKKLISFTTAITALASVSAQAQLVIQPTVVQPAPPTYYAAPAPVYAEPYYGYGGSRWERHHRYDWGYWHGHEGEHGRGGEYEHGGEHRR